MTKLTILNNIIDCALHRKMYIEEHREPLGEEDRERVDNVWREWNLIKYEAERIYDRIWDDKKYKLSYKEESFITKNLKRVEKVEKLQEKELEELAKAEARIKAKYQAKLMEV